MTDPVDFLLRAAMRLPRREIERLTEGLIAGLDVLDGDPDLGPDGDELDGSQCEDDLWPLPTETGKGFPHQCASPMDVPVATRPVKMGE